MLGGHGLAGLVQAVGLEETEAPVQQRQAVVGTLLLRRPAHQHRDQALVAALGRAQQAVAGRRGMPGLDAVHARVAPQQQVAVGLGDVAYGEFLDLVVRIRLGEVADQRAPQQRQVVRGGDMALGGQPVRVDEVGRLHADLLGVGIHQLGERLLAAGDVFGQRDRGIVAGLHHHALFHLLQRYEFQ
ncbi:hypothetical protein SDC9_150334 [bioreactor metagenome]|uniref:Uncharacterized protein n=1 Tax=bioreactor metagenome TaxID=1076179 RepID=A0A645EM71_9ZZZZ